MGTQIVQNVILNMNFNSFYNQTIIKGVQSPENQNLVSQEKEENSVLFHTINLDFTDSLHLFDLLSIYCTTVCNELIKKKKCYVSLCW